MLSACGPEVWNWKEEAILDGGRKIVIEREVVFAGTRLPWERDRLQSEYVIRFSAPDNPALRYEYRSIGGLEPGLVAFVNGVPYVLGEAVRGDAITYYDCPDPGFVIHRFDGSGWKRADLRELPATLKKKNLAMFTREAAVIAKSGVLASAEQIESWNNGESAGKRAAGRFANTAASTIPRPENGMIAYECNVPGKPTALLNLGEFKQQIRKALPANIE